jgi:hypothetical protein
LPLFAFIRLYSKGLNSRGFFLLGRSISVVNSRELGLYSSGLYLRELFLRGLFLRGLFLRGLYLKADLLENLKKHLKEQEFFLLKKKSIVI